MGKTNIFVSSTCFDLQQIRRDLENFIRDLGHNPVLSDSEEIGIPSGLDNLDTCKWLVTTSDIFVLIIGGRVGNLDLNTGKSITNLEYDLAYELGIPIYTFVDNEVWTKRETYYSLKELLIIEQISENNLKDALGAKIEHYGVFEFIEQVSKAARDQWIFPFTEANDITKILKNNLSTLLKQCLSEKRKGEVEHATPKLLPDLRLSLCKRRFESYEDEPIDFITFSPMQILNRQTIGNQLLQLRPQDSTINLISERSEEIKRIIQHLDPAELGLKKTPENVDDFLLLVSKFAKHIDKMMEMIDKDFDHLENYNFLMGRSVQVDFLVYNDGNVPAEEIVIYINSTDKIQFMKWEDLKKADITIPSDLPKNVKTLIDIAKNIDALNETRPNFSNTRLDVFRELGFRDPVDLASIIGQQIGQQKDWSIYIQDKRIRINLRRLKHQFHYKITNDDIHICSFLRNGEVEEVPYECHADNLPKATSGVIKFIAG